MKYMIKFGIDFGTMITITNITLLIVVFFINKKNIGLSTLFVVLLNQYPVDFFSSIITLFCKFHDVMYCVIGAIFVAIGCNIMICSKLGMGIYDALLFGIAEKTNKSYVFIRYIVDGIFLVLTFLLKGYIGIGTIIPYLIVGNLITITQPYIKKLLK